MKNARNIILASQSPRRRVLLDNMGVDFRVIASNFEEYFDESRSPEKIASELGLGKANTVARQYPEAIIIGSDLIAVLDGKQIGKPETEAEAKSLLRAFSGRTHQLICSVAVVCIAQAYEKVDTEAGYVTFKPFTEEFISQYVATGTVYDKAGGYALQHPMIQSVVERVEGRRDTIIGLPCNLVAHFLNDFGYALHGADILPSSPLLYE